ncbi:hypothetical protein KBZ17_02000 [Cyanobium sp. A2C-AMD]|nr:hypothetical protein [Cyanobium sp. A2C-AMD]
MTQFLGLTLVDGPTELPGPKRKLSAWAKTGAMVSKVLAARVAKERPGSCIEAMAVISPL